MERGNKPIGNQLNIVTDCFLQWMGDFETTFLFGMQKGSKSIPNGINDSTV